MSIKRKSNKRVSASDIMSLNIPDITTEEAKDTLESLKARTNTDKDPVENSVDRGEETKEESSVKDARVQISKKKEVASSKKTSIAEKKVDKKKQPLANTELSKSVKDLIRLQNIEDPEGDNVHFTYTMNEETLKKLQKLSLLFELKTEQSLPRKHYIMRKIVEDWVQKNYDKMLNDLI